MLKQREIEIVVAAGNAYLGVEVDPARHAARVAAILERTDAEKVKEFRIALKIIDSRVTGLITTRRAERFVAAPRERRDARLARFSRSRFSLFRKIYIALQRTSAAAYYSDPVHYSEVGYDGPASHEEHRERQSS